MDSSAAHSEKVLLLDPNQDVGIDLIEALQDQAPNIDLWSSTKLDQFEKLVEDEEFDLVIIDYDIAVARGIELIHRLKLENSDPSILILSANQDPRAVAQAMNLGCQRYIIKQGSWIDELGPAVRHALRLRKLEHENFSLLGRLTEANRILEEKNRRLDDFSATVAHDIRGLIAGLSMRLDYIYEESQSVLDEKLVHMIKAAVGTCSRLTDIVQATYDFARLGAQAARMKTVNLESLVEELISDMSFDPQLDINIGIHDLPEVWGNSTLLRRVFINLINNAVKYNDKEQIIINVGFNGCTSTSLGQYAAIYVEDNGCGICEKHISRVFDMFWRVDKADNTKQSQCEGLGVGLSVVRRIIELHMGNIRVESTPASGTKFTMLLPLEEVELVG